jgi:hypothetical protein
MERIMTSTSENFKEDAPCSLDALEKEQETMIDEILSIQGIRKLNTYE